LISSKPEYAFVAWNSIAVTDSSKLERIEKCSTHCHRIFFQNIQYHYDNSLEELNVKILHTRCRHTDPLYLINSYHGVKCCPSVLETVCIRVPARNMCT
jgi:hypothetical protein